MKKLYYIDMIWAPALTITLGMESISKVSDLTLILAGFGTWTFIEYAVHRGLHHFNSAAHLDHHRDPSGKHGPDALSTAGIVAWFYFFSLLALGFSPANIFMTGFLTGYTAYLYLHHGIHMTKLLPYSSRRLRHEAHHRWENNYYGVTTRFWDWFF